MINDLFSLANFSSASRFLESKTTTTHDSIRLQDHVQDQDQDQRNRQKKKDQDKDQETKTKTTAIHVLCYFSFFDAQENTVF